MLLLRKVRVLRRSVLNALHRSGRGMSSTSASPARTKAPFSSRVERTLTRRMRRSSTRRTNRTSTWLTALRLKRQDRPALLLAEHGQAEVVLTTIAVAVVAAVRDRVAVAVGPVRETNSQLKL